MLFEPEASTELEEAALWYQAQRHGLGAAFLAAVDQAVGHVMAWPDAGMLVPGLPGGLSVRKAPVPRFPYHLAYLVAADAVRVLAVAHDHRRPGYWHPRADP